MKSILIKNWFLPSILLVILIAEIVPHIGIVTGSLVHSLVVKYGSVPAIFFICGISITTKELKDAAKKCKVHTFIQIFTSILMPISVKILTLLMSDLNINEWILKGMLVTSCMPLSPSSVIIIIKCIGGNEAVAIFNSIIGNVLGIIVTPVLLLLFLKNTAVISPLKSALDVILTVILPLFIGQVIHKTTNIQMTHTIVETVGQFALLMVIFTTFCEIFQSHQSIELHPIDVLLTVLFVVCLQLLLLFLIFWTTHCLMNSFTPADTVTIMFCSTHKSLSLGIPILHVLYTGYSHMYTISLPLLVYFPSQVILGELLAPVVRDWLKSKQQTQCLL